MQITLLEYIKLILEKVSFDARLFEKELRKAISQLLPSEIRELRLWCYEKFGKYKGILRRSFSLVLPTKS